MTTLARMRLAVRVIGRYVRVRLLLAGLPLPTVVDRLGTRGRPHRISYSARQLGNAVEKLLRLPGRPLRCLPRALVLYSLLADEGHDPRLAIGLAESSPSVDAHAWVELDGADVGPSPGKDGHEPIAVYPLRDSA